MGSKELKCGIFFTGRELVMETFALFRGLNIIYKICFFRKDVIVIISAF